MNIMKSILLLTIVVLFGISDQILGQELVKNEVDDFTNNTVKRTSWETINMTLEFAAYFRVSKINDNFYFDLKMMMGTSVFSIDKGQELMFKLANEEIIKLPNLNYAITCKGCGARGFSGSEAQGIKVSYPITLEQIKKLNENMAVKIRIYTNAGYVENDLKLKYQKKIQKALLLFE